jgi:hypothetical protein
MIDRIGLAVAGLLAFSGMAGAHPHSYVDQQALIFVGLDALDLTIRIVPSFEDGAAIFAHIDSDGNGFVSDREATAFGAAVVAKAELEVDGREVTLLNALATVPSIEQLAAGGGVIEVEAQASFALGSGGKHRLVFGIAYEDLSHDWFIQPFFYRGLVDTGSPVVQRTDTGNRVGIVFSSGSALRASDAPIASKRYDR